MIGILDWIAMETARILLNADSLRRPIFVRVSDGNSECTIKTPGAENEAPREPMMPIQVERLMACWSETKDIETVSARLRKNLENYWAFEDEQAFRIASFGAALASDTQTVQNGAVTHE